MYVSAKHKLLLLTCWAFILPFCRMSIPDAVCQPMTAQRFVSARMMKKVCTLPTY